MKGKVIVTFIAFFFGIALSSEAQSRKYKKHYKPKHHKVYHRTPARSGTVVVLPAPPRPPRPVVVRAPRPVIVLPPAPPRPPLPPRPGG